MNFGGDHPAHGHGKISPRCVPKLPAMARYRPGAFPRCRPWRDCALMRSRRGLGRGNTGLRQHIACMHSNTASFGKICVPCIRKAPQSAAGECAARTSCRQGALSPSEALRSCTAHESCHPPMALPLRRGSCPSNRIAGSPFNGLALAQGCSPQRSADARHLPIPATRQCLPLAVPVAARGKPPMGFGGGHPAHGLQFGRAPRGRDYVISTGRPTTECCAELGLDSRTVSKRAQNLRRRPQARPVLRQRCRKRPSKGRVPCFSTGSTPQRDASHSCSRPRGRRGIRDTPRRYPPWR